MRIIAKIKKGKFSQANEILGKYNSRDDSFIGLAFSNLNIFDYFNENLCGDKNEF